MRARTIIIACACVVLALGLAAPVASAGTWQKHATSGPRPSERSVPAVAALGTSVYVFGGVKDDFSTQLNTFHNDLHRFDTLTNTWDLISPAGTRPSPRAFAAAVGHEPSGRFLVFGGGIFGPLFTGFTVFNDLWAYSVAENTWTELRALNTGPTARSGAHAWIADNRLYIFGGITSIFATLNDLWVYNLDTNRWTELLPNGAAGSPPSRHVAQGGSKPVQGKLTIYGGEGDLAGGFRTFGDTWQFDIKANRWEGVTPAPEDNIQPPRNYGAAAIIGNGLYLQGGDLPGGSQGCGAPFPQNPTEELWRFDLIGRVWTRLSPGGDPLVRLKRHAAASLGGRMYVFSGWDFQCPDGVTGPGQIWNLDVYSFSP